jgi:hypothetical protein
LLADQSRVRGSFVLVERGLAYSWGYQLGTPGKISGTFPGEIDPGFHTGILRGSYQNLPFPVRFDPGTNSWIAVFCNHSRAFLLDETRGLWAIPFQPDHPPGRTIAVPVKIARPAGVSGWRSVATDSGAGYLVSLEGGLYTFAADWTNAPVRFPDNSDKSDWTQVAATRFHALAIDAEGRLFGWGLNLYGHLGPAATEWFPRAPIPLHEPPGGGRWRIARVGGKHSAALTEDGRLYSWGTGHRGQLGGTEWYPLNVVQPPFPESVNRWLEVWCGTDYTLALGDDGVLYEWGSNGWRPDGGIEVRAFPPPAGSGGWQQATAGEYHRLARARDGRLYAWGSNFVGQLGRGRSGREQAMFNYFTEYESRAEPEAVPVKMPPVESSNRAPSARLLAPLHGSEFGHPRPLQLAAQVIDPEGELAEVEFVINTSLVLPARQETNGLFIADWPDAPQGEYPVQVRAVDARGAEGWSEDNWLALLPYVSIAPGRPAGREPGFNDPGEPASFIIRRTGPATDPLQLDVMLDTQGMSATANVDFVWPDNWRAVTVPAGTNATELFIEIKADRIEEPDETVTVFIRHARAAPGEPVAASVVIRNTPDDPRRPNEPPWVTPLFPGDGAVFLRDSPLLLKASYNDHDGYVTNFAWYAGGELLASHAWSLPVLPPGLHLVRALVIDNEGAATWSDPMEITVLDEPNAPGPNVISFTTLDPLAVRGTDDVARIRVTRSGDAFSQLTVFHREEGSARRGQDYEDGTPGRFNFFVGQVSTVLEIRALANHRAPPGQAVEFRVTAAPPGHGGVYVPAGEEPSPSATIYLIQPPVIDEGSSPDTIEPVLFNLEADPAGGLFLRTLANPGTSFRLEHSRNGDAWEPFHQINGSSGNDAIVVPPELEDSVRLFRATAPDPRWKRREVFRRPP